MADILAIDFFIIDISIIVISIIVAILILIEHEKNQKIGKRNRFVTAEQNQKATNHPFLRRLYLKALKENNRSELHRWLNKTQGDIRIGHVYLVKQHVLNKKPLPYPIPTF